MLALLVHRLHDRAYYRGKDRTAACAANRIAEKAAECPARSRIGTRSTPKEASKNCASSDAADRATDDFGQLAHRHLLQEAGESWTEMPGDHHKVSANASSTKPARLLAIFIVDTTEQEIVIPDK